MHREITDSICTIYYTYAAESLYKDKKYTYKQLSIMKQENIQEAIQNKNYTKNDILDVINSKCGYCFGFYNHMNVPRCKECPLMDKSTLKMDCMNKEYIIFRNILLKEGRFQRKKALEAHKAWLRSLNF